jgi:hypothetical protein
VDHPTELTEEIAESSISDANHHIPEQTFELRPPFSIIKQFAASVRKSKQPATSVRKQTLRPSHRLASTRNSTASG